jgi:hypothetical protein
VPQNLIIREVMPARPKSIKGDAPPVLTTLSLESPFSCPGIQEDNPRDFLAALGFLRLLECTFPEHTISLSWSPDGIPAFTSTTPLPGTFLESAVSYLKNLNIQKPHPFVHHQVIKVALDDYRKAVARSLEFYSESKLPAALYAAYASQIHDQKEGDASPTSFSFSNGQGGKELLRDISELLNREWNAAQLQADLAGDLGARKEAKSFRWHPLENRAAAYRAADPGTKIKGDVISDHPSLNVLAFFGLSFYPVVDRVAREFTCGFSRRKNNSSPADYFTWPIWETPLSASALSSLLLHPALHSETLAPFTSKSLGCLRVWCSRRFSADKSLYFSPATQVC